MRKPIQRVLIGADVFNQGLFEENSFSSQILILCYDGIFKPIIFQNTVDSVKEKIKDIENINYKLNRFLESSKTTIIQKENELKKIGVDVFVTYKEKIRLKTKTLTPEQYLETFPCVYINKTQTVRNYDKYILNIKPTVIVFASEKGGTAKTTITANTASCLAETGKKVLLIDLDSQANLTTSLGVEYKQSKPHLKELLLDEATLDEVIVPTNIPNLFIVPSSTLCADMEYKIQRKTSRPEFPELKLQKILKSQTNQLKRFDFILIDTPPCLGTIVTMAIAASNIVIIPLQLHRFAIEGLQILKDLIEVAEEDLGKPQGNWYIVPSLVQKRKIQMIRLNQVVSMYPDKVLDIEIPYNSKIYESSDAARPVNLFPRSSIASETFRNLAEIVLKISSTKEK